MTSLPLPCRAGLLLGLLACSVVLTAAAEEKPFRAIRARDQVTLTAGPGILSFNETITMTPTDVDKKLPPGRPNLLHVLIPPLWMREGTAERPAFNTQRPYFQSSGGRVRSFALLKPDGERVLTEDQMTPECVYVLTLEFGHVIPQKFTVEVSFVSTRGINPDADYLYKPSNDGYAVRSGPTESVFTDLRINTDPSLENWRVLLENNELPRKSGHTVQLQREAGHVIRFNNR